MKYIKKYSLYAVVAVLLLTACKKFETVNEDPYLVTEDQVQVEYFINGAIVNAQMDPHIAESLYYTGKLRGSSSLGEVLPLVDTMTDGQAIIMEPVLWAAG